MLIDFDHIRYSVAISVDKWRWDIFDIDIFIHNLVNNGALIIQAEQAVVLNYALSTL